jgi:hypothetical protein
VSLPGKIKLSFKSIFNKLIICREPFSFGGINRSKFGNFVDITGDGGVEFFTWRRKVTTRWGQENLDPKLRM